MQNVRLSVLTQPEVEMSDKLNHCTISPFCTVVCSLASLGGNWSRENEEEPILLGLGLITYFDDKLYPGTMSTFYLVLSSSVSFGFSRSGEDEEEPIGGNPFWVGNEIAPYNISTINGLIRPHQGNLYNLRPCRFQISYVEGVAASIPWRSFDFNVFLHTPKCFWLRDFPIFNVKIYSQIFLSYYQNLAALKYKRKRQIIGNKQKYIEVTNLFRN